MNIKAFVTVSRYIIDLFDIHNNKNPIEQETEENGFGSFRITNIRNDKACI